MLKNYTSFANQEEKKEKTRSKTVRVDQAEQIKKKIKEQEEQIQALKNAVSVYFVDKCAFVNFREDKSKNSLVITKLKHGTLIEPVIYNDTNEWTKATYQNRTGYIMTKYIGVEISEPIE